MVKIGEDFYADGILASPAVRSYASSQNVNINLVKGTAQHGRILKEDVDTFVASGRAGKAIATPAVRALARKLGIDISQVYGTGEAGRVLKEDLYNFGHEEDDVSTQVTTTQVSRELPAPSGAENQEYEVYQFNQIE